jgi:hypothetical protein
MDTQLVASVIILFLVLWSIGWVYGDAKGRVEVPWAAALLVGLLFWPISLLAWLVFRPKIKNTDGQ